MKAYKLAPGGVVRRADGAFVPESLGNRSWRAYQRWVALGNTPDPEFSPEEAAQKMINSEIVNLKANLQSNQVWLFRMLLEMWKAAKAAGVVKNADIDPEVLAKAGTWVAKLNRLKEIDE